MIKTYLVPITDEVIKAMEKGEAPSFLHCATCLDGLTNGEVKWLSVIEDINKQLEKLINKPCVNQNMMAQNLAYRNVQEMLKKQLGEVTHERT